jgi:hypothetical protein
MAYNEKLAYAPQDADGVVQDIKGYKDVGYNGELGIVAPNIYFKGDFEEELATQTFHDVPKAWGEMAKVDEEKDNKTVTKTCLSNQQTEQMNLTTRPVKITGLKKIQKITNGPLLTMTVHR